MTLCRDWSLVKEDGQTTTCEPLYCRSWGCEICHPRRCRQLRSDARSGAPDKFLTLSVNSSRNTCPHENARALSWAFKRLIERMRRRYPGQEIQYLAVFEKTKKGQPHLHILLRCPYVPQKWISDTMKALIGAPVVDIRQIRNHRGVALYVTKYIGKDPEKFEGTKRYWTSRGYLRDPANDDARVPSPKPRFYIFKGSREDWRASQAAWGYLAWQEGDIAYGWRPPPRPPPAILVLGFRP